MQGTLLIVFFEKLVLLGLMDAIGIENTGLLPFAEILEAAERNILKIPAYIPSDRQNFFGTRWSVLR